MIIWIHFKNSGGVGPPNLEELLLASFVRGEPFLKPQQTHGLGRSRRDKCIASRVNFEEVVAYAHGLNLKEVLFLRVKPSGRARNVFHEFKLTHQQNIKFFPFLIKLICRIRNVLF